MPLSARAMRVEPEPKRDADGVVPGPVERDRAVDAAAHRNGDAASVRRRVEDLGDGIRDRVGGERVAGGGCGFEQRQTAEGRAIPGASA